jgi:PleD family two-component response regulator
MSRVLYKKKIAESLEVMDADKLKQAWLILKEIGTERKLSPVTHKKKLEVQISKGIRQLDKGEGTDFSSFIVGLKKKYGKS